MSKYIQITLKNPMELACIAQKIEYHKYISNVKKL